MAHVFVYVSAWNTHMALASFISRWFFHYFIHISWHSNGTFAYFIHLPKQIGVDNIKQISQKDAHNNNNTAKSVQFKIEINK